MDGPPANGKRNPDGTIVGQGAVSSPRRADTATADRMWVLNNRFSIFIYQFSIAGKVDQASGGSKGLSQLKNGN